LLLQPFSFAAFCASAICDFTSAMKVSIVVPVYNEKPTLAEVVRRVAEAPLPDGMTREIIVVNDGSTDGTGAVLEDLAAIYPTLISHDSAVNAGKGSALRIGIARATGDIILVQDGDLEYNPEEYPRILQPIVTGAARIVYGSRFQTSVSGMRWSNWLANRLLTWTANVLYRAHLTDEATAYKAFDAALLKSLELSCRRFEFCPEVTAKLRRLGVDIAEVAITYQPRRIEDGKKIRYTDGFHALWTLVKYRIVPIRRVRSCEMQPRRHAEGHEVSVAPSP
jgi:glycosyltransferase involved in cell wall biosynthesis